MLESFLANKPLFYDEIDYTRMPRIYKSIKNEIKLPKIIHLVGTNGKGTTGRFLASALYSLGYNTGHYTSPHILEFNERIWLNGKNVSNETLDNFHQKLLRLLAAEDAEALSYFEYTTLLALLIYQECDYVILEAGLGGEHDATAVFENILTVVTPIDRDHEAFLGETIEQIATTKLNAIKTHAILANQKYEDVYRVAKRLHRKKELTIESFEYYIDKEDRDNAEILAKEMGLVEYLKENLMVAIATLKHLNISYTKENFYNSRLFGRLTQLNENVLLDVGHNELAAKKVRDSLEPKKYILVYNSYKDKNYKEILSILKPIIDHVEIIEIDEQRVAAKEALVEALSQNMIAYRDFKGVEPGESYLVFGSFSVVEAFLKGYSG